MIRIGILEDEAEQAGELLSFLARYQQTHPDFAYTSSVFDTGERLLFHYGQGFDLLFLDIQVPDMLGIEAARKIREKDESVMIIFVTNLSQYAIDGYSVQAFDYILKPLLYGSFAVKLGRIRHVLSRSRNGQFLTVKTKQEVFHLDVSLLWYVEISGHDLLFVTEKGEYQGWGTLRGVEQELEGQYFSRCSACYLVNLRYVDSVRGSTVYVRGRALSVSRARRKEFLDDLARFKGGSI